MNHKDFFKKFSLSGNITVEKAGYKTSVSFEELYQVFKERYESERDSESVESQMMQTTLKKAQADAVWSRGR